MVVSIEGVKVTSIVREVSLFTEIIKKRKVQADIARGRENCYKSSRENSSSADDCAVDKENFFIIYGYKMLCLVLSNGMMKTFLRSTANKTRHFHTFFRWFFFRSAFLISSLCTFSDNMFFIS